MLKRAAHIITFGACALWSMLLVPAATPKEIVARLAGAVMKALAASDVRERYAGMGVEPAPSTPERAAA